MIHKKIYPETIDNSNFRYIKLDNMLIASLIISDYPRQASFIQILNSFPENIEYDLSIYVKKQNTRQVLKEITYNIASTISEIKTINKNQMDIDILDKTKTDSEKLRYDIQINNEEVYKIYMIFTIHLNLNIGESKIFDILKIVESRLYTKQLSVNYANFRQMQAYIATLPFSSISEELIGNTNRLFTTRAVANIYPFYTKNMFDKDGIMFGMDMNSKKICNINIFSNNYLNANMCVFGSTGSGKSYYIKISIIRNNIMGRRQYVFDPEGEYYSVCNKLKGQYISYTKNLSIINILDISYEYLMEYKENFLKVKIDSVISILRELVRIDEEETGIIYSAIVQSYLEKGIDYNKNSMYEELELDRVLIEKRIKQKGSIPSLKDVFDNICKVNKNCTKSKEKSKYKNLITKFKSEILDKVPFLSSTTNCNYTSLLTVFDLSGINKNLASIYIKYVLDEIKLKLKYSNENNKDAKTIIYIDEIWKYIGSYGNYKLSQEIFSMFKTIRKLNSSIVAITQDIQDFFEYENGIYGKSILNNSGFKIIFKTEYIDTKFLKDIGIGGIDILDSIYKLEKGQAFVIFKDSFIKISVQANEIEKSIIEGDRNEDNSSFR